MGYHKNKNYFNQYDITLYVEQNKDIYTIATNIYIQIITLSFISLLDWSTNNKI